MARYVCDIYAVLRNGVREWMARTKPIEAPNEELVKELILRRLDELSIIGLWLDPVDIDHYDVVCRETTYQRVASRGV